MVAPQHAVGTTSNVDKRMLTMVMRRFGRDGEPLDRTQMVRELLAGAGVVAAAVIAASTFDGGLPESGNKRVAALALTALALVVWLVSLVQRVRDARLLAACLLVVGLAGAWLDVLAPSGPGFILAYMAMAGMGLRLPRRAALAVGSVVVVAAGLAEAHTSAHPLAAALNLAMGAGFLFLAAAFAGVSRDAHLQTQALLAQQEATRAAQEEAAVLAERGRLARELHDVLAHTLSGLAVKLEGARLLAAKVDADPRLTAQIGNAAQLARDGMTGAKRAVSTLRGERLPGPDEIGDLVEHARLAGLPTTLTVTGEPRLLPAADGLAVYRTVQEALTNSTKYAGAGAVAEVTLDWQPETLCVQVTDRGGSGAAAGLPSTGVGLAGLAERAALAGGRLERGPTSDGWRVVLVMPIRASVHSAVAR